jgi:hypothetical protein
MTGFDRFCAPMRWFSTRMRQNALGLSHNTTAFDRFWSCEIGVCSAFLTFLDPPPLPPFFAEAQFAWKSRCFYTF